MDKMKIPIWAQGKGKVEKMVVRSWKWLGEKALNANS